MFVYKMKQEYHFFFVQILVIKYKAYKDSNLSVHYLFPVLLSRERAATVT